MSKAAELLQSLAPVQTEEDLTTLVVDNYLRSITIPKGITNLGVQNDDEVLRLNFKMPRFLGTTDLSEFSIRINYCNANGEGDVYTVSSPTIGQTNITFSWLVGPNATKYKGLTRFIICAVKLTADGYIDKEYNTTIASLPVLEGLETNSKAVARYSDVLEQWRRELFGIGDTEEAGIKAASEAEQEAIEQKGIEVLATIPEDYQSTYAMANDAYRTKADAIVCESQGEVISVHDSSDDPIRGLRIFGKTTQVTTTGKNLLQITTSGETVAGITYTVNPDGTVIASGTASDTSTLILNSDFLFEAGVGYTLSGCPAGGGVDTYRLDDVSRIADDGVGGSVVYSENTTTQIRVRIAKETTVNNLLFKPMIRLTSIDDDTFEPYSGGISSPSPGWAQSMMSVDSPVVKVHTSNLFGGSTMADKIYSVSKATTSIKDEAAGTVSYSGGGINAAVLCEGIFKPNQQYTLILYGKNTTAPSGYSYTNLAFLYDDCTIGPGNPMFETYGEDSYAVFTSEVGKTVKALIGKWASGTVVVYYNKCGLFEGVKTAADFEPYHEQTIDLTAIAAGIPVSQNGNYTDVNGRQWICDEIDFEHGVYIQRIGKKILDGATDRPYFSTHSNGQNYCAVYPTDIVYNSPVISDRYMFSVANWSNTNNYLYGTGGAIVVNDSRFTNVDDITTLWSVEKPEVQYVLATPIEIPLTAEEIAAFREVRSNCHNTTILNYAGAWMSIKYNADTKTYVENPKVLKLVDSSTGVVYELKIVDGVLTIDPV